MDQYYENRSSLSSTMSNQSTNYCKSHRLSFYERFILNNSNNRNENEKKQSLLNNNFDNNKIKYAYNYYRSQKRSKFNWQLNEFDSYSI
jgi:hypothetical protein